MSGEAADETGRAGVVREARPEDAEAAIRGSYLMDLSVEPDGRTRGVGRVVWVILDEEMAALGVAL